MVNMCILTKNHVNLDFLLVQTPSLTTSLSLNLNALKVDILDHLVTKISDRTGGMV